MAGRLPRSLWLAWLVVAGSGCHHPSITAVSLNPTSCDQGHCSHKGHHQAPEGIPFYLPKPLLIVSKNFRNIEEAKVGLTDTAPIPNYFDDQAKFADLNARTNFAMPDGGGTPNGQTSATPDQKFPDKDASNLASKSGQHIYSTGGAPVTPGAVAPDGMRPEAFFTYHIIFVPDLTQKYGLKIKGGAGEIRAAMNLVNGWQFTGLGPYYMKDSSTAQNTLAGGITANLAASGVADVVKAVAGLKPGASTGAKQLGVGQADVVRSLDVNTVNALSNAMRDLNPKFLTIPNFAQISIYEPYLSPEGTMEWRLIVEQHYDRDVVATNYQPDQVLDLLKSAASGAATDPAKVEPTNSPSPLAPPLVDPRGKTDKAGAGTPGVGEVPAAPEPGIGSKPETPAIPGGANFPPLPLPEVPIGLVRPRADASLLRTQGMTPPPNNSAAVVASVARSLAGETKTIELSNFSRTDGNELITRNNKPAFTIMNTSANALIELFRVDKGVVVAHQNIGTRAIPKFPLVDSSGVTEEGDYTYELRSTSKQVTSRLGTITITYKKPELPDSTPPTQVAGPVVLSTAVDQVVGRFPGLLDKTLGSSTPASPTSGPATNPGGLVTVNQFFGKTKIKGEAPPAAPRHFSLFHHKQKQKHEIRTVNLEGIATEAATAVTAPAAQAVGKTSVQP